MSEGYIVTIQTAVFSDGEMTLDNAESQYDTLFLRRLVEANGDVPYGVPGIDGGDYVTVPGDHGMVQTTVPGGSFTDDQAANGATYLYVVDAHAGAIEETDVARIVVTVDAQTVPDPGGTQTTDNGVTYRLVETRIVPTDELITFKIVSEIIVPDDITIVVVTADSTLELTLKDLTTHSLRVGDYIPHLTDNRDTTYSLMLKFQTDNPRVPTELITAIQAGDVIAMDMNMPFISRPRTSPTPVSGVTFLGNKKLTPRQEQLVAAGGGVLDASQGVDPTASHFPGVGG